MRDRSRSNVSTTNAPPDPPYGPGQGPALNSRPPTPRRRPTPQSCRGGEDRPHQDRPQPPRRDRRRRPPRRPRAAHPAHRQGDVPHLHGRRPAIGLHELAAALKTRDINVPLIPVVLGGAAMLTGAYWAAGGAVLAVFALTVLGVLIAACSAAPRATSGTSPRACSHRLPRRCWAPRSRRCSPTDGGKRVLIFVVLDDLQRHRRLLRGHHPHPAHRRPQDGPGHHPQEDVGGPGGLGVLAIVAGAHPGAGAAARPLVAGGRHRGRRGRRGRVR